ncbi:MAG: hypothetical protein WCG12_03455 [Alcaligenaceae bacterium]
MSKALYSSVQLPVHLEQPEVAQQPVHLEQPEVAQQPVHLKKPEFVQLPRASELGQVLPLGLILSAVVLAAWVLSLNLGRLVHSKASLLRATDAAVYSVAVAQARALNLHAYLNRAQLAQQVAMAHLITMASAQRYRATLAQQASRFNPPVPLIGMLFGPQYAASYLAAKAGGLGDQVALAQLSDAFNRHDEVIHRVIDQVRGEQIRKLSSYRRQVLDEVLIKNVGASGSSMKGVTMAELGLEATFTVDELPGFISRFSSADKRWHSLLTRVSKQYGFLNNRHHTTRNVWAVNLRCPHKRHELRRKGLTRLGQDGAWSVQDNQSFHALRHNRMIGCYQREYPMGWALVNSTAGSRTTQPIQTDTEPQNFSKESFWRWVSQQADGGWNIFSGGDNHLARRWASSSEIRWSTQGMPSFAALTPKHKESIRLAIAVKQQSPLIHDGSAVETTRFGGRFAVSSQDRVQTLHAESAAQTYFLSPQTSGNATAAPNLFQPFWHARLIDVAETKQQRTGSKSLVNTLMSEQSTTQ